MELLPFTPAYFPILASWFTSQKELAQWGSTALDYPLDDAQMQAMLEGSTDNPPLRKCWMARHEGALVGHVQLFFDWRDGIARLARVAIAPSLRGRGLAAPMLKLAMAEAFHYPQIMRLELNVYSFNQPAIRAYLRLGFLVEGTRRSSAAVGSERWDTIHMAVLRDYLPSDSTCIIPLSLDLPSEFTTERLTCRCYAPGDAGMYAQMLWENREHLGEFLPPELEAIHNAEDARRRFRQLREEWEKHNLLIFGVWEKANGTYVGESYLANADWEVPRIELGYFIIKSQTGKGYATEAARATAGYAFKHLKVTRLDLRVAVDNPASIRVAEHCGFILEGRFRSHHRKKDCSLVDMLWYGLLRSEWEGKIEMDQIKESGFSDPGRG